MRLIVCLFIIFLFSITSYSQKAIDQVHIKCIYSLQFKLDSTNLNKKSEEDMILKIGKNNHSEFLSYNQQYSDSVFSTASNRPIGNINEKEIEMLFEKVRQIPRTKFKFKIYKNYPVNKITTTDEVLRDKYMYEEPISTIRWKIHPEQRTISGYKCQKATGSFAGRNYIAWFTNEIPVSDGPYKFNGLPGLIVTIADTRNQYVFTLKKVEKAKTGQYIYFPDDKLIKTTKKAYFKAYQDFKENAGQRYEDMGFTAMDPDHNRKVNERFKKQNNPIELVVE